MVIFAIMENTAQTGLNDKRNLLVCDNQKFEVEWAFCEVQSICSVLFLFVTPPFSMMSASS